MKKSPIKFVGGAIGTAAGAMGTQPLLGGLRGLFGVGGGNAARHTGVGGLGADYAGQGSRIITTPGAGAQFNPEAIQAASGIFGDINARQATVGGGGIFRKTSKYDNV